VTIRSISARRSRSSCERGAIAWVQGHDAVQRAYDRGEVSR